MAGKGFCVKIRLELHAITCPGVWLCPNGKVGLRITSLGITLESHRVSPIFPLLFHNEFHFKKTFTRLAGLTELQRSLEQESFYAELIQWLDPCSRPIILATFETELADLLYPGIIAPKIEVSTKTVIEEVKTRYDPSFDGAYVVNPKTIESKRNCCSHRKRPIKGIIRQKKVCHSRAKAKIETCVPAKYRCESCHREPSSRTTAIRYCHPRTQRSISVESRPRRRVSSVCDNLHIFENCPVCLKYKCYFSCDRDRRHSDKSVQNLKDSRYDFDQCCCCCRHARICSSLQDDNLDPCEKDCTTLPETTIRCVSRNKTKSRSMEEHFDRRGTNRIEIETL
ncbi:uncharacterized protein LOC108627157 isoform X2 [Ceratina calcarata]|uniref:Uncharacterized protein LOC108627157 isoform X2 n=1 Tax=Ceratina calcarata TaxID=156304 RepID=A0AAJ7S450_9HYME|nr:uncharacterized protein LOC108627157 isoform X2 [Ceratina calcarata]